MSLNEGRGDFIPEDARKGNANTPQPMATDFTGPLKGGPIVCKGHPDGRGRVAVMGFDVGVGFG
jgi:hypothetical protein